MTTYNVPLVGVATVTVEVETTETDPEAIVRLAQDKANPRLCHQCADHRNDSLMLGEEWAPNLDNGKPEVYEVG